MKAVTLVKGKVPSTKTEEFESIYRSRKRDALPRGLEMSMLLKGNSEGQGRVYTIQTIWSSREALEAMRSSEKPKAVVTFEEVGVSPTVEIQELIETVP